ncbi:MAG: ribosome maturation factor RimM [Candidatus Adiutrix sp.]|nr:ribosome maturation factor RimM [Candidatus Adiutrix sp.]
MTEQPSDDLLVVGHVARAHGLHGALLITSYAEDPRVILDGRHLELLSPDGQERRPVASLKGRPAARGLIVRIRDLTTREAAAALKGWRLVMERRHLPEPAEDEVYWADLLGLTVFDARGLELGRVERLMEAGAGLILVLASALKPGQELLLPYQEEFLLSLDLGRGRLVLDPPPGLLDL